MSDDIRLRKEKRQESILNTALTVLSKEGFDGLSMRKLAKAEGISEAMLYRFFKNKYAILRIILKTNVEKITNEWKDFMETVKALVPKLEISLPIIGKMMAKTISENQAFFQYMIRDSPKFGRVFSKMNKEIEEGFQGLYFLQNAIESIDIIGVLTNYFTRCQQAGDLRKDLLPKDCAILVTSNLLPLIIHLPILVLGVSVDDYDILKLVDIQIKVMLKGMLRE